jgi:ACS family glucarate transporter-like MFS transporter
VEIPVRQSLGLTETQSGLVLSAFFIAYAAAQIPSAECAQRLGARFTLAVSIVAFSFATAGIGLSAGLMSLMVARVAMGVGQAGLLPCTTEILARWFHPSQRGFVNGLVGGFLSVGGAAGAILTGYLTPFWGWREVHGVFAIPGLLLGWALWLWLRNRPAQHPRVNLRELALIDPDVAAPALHSPASAGAEWKAILVEPALFWLCGQQFFRAAGYMFYTSWFTTFLQERYGIELSQAGLMTSLPILTTVAGSAVGGALSDVLTAQAGRRVGRQWLAVASMLACAGIILAASTISAAWPAVLAISFGSFCAAFAGPCAAASVTDLAGAQVPRVFATMNMCGNIGAAVFPVIVPPFTALTGNWQVVLLLFAAIYVAGGLCWLAFDSGKQI